MNYIIATILTLIGAVLSILAVLNHEASNAEKATFVLLYGVSLMLLDIRERQK